MPFFRRKPAAAPKAAPRKRVAAKPKAKPRAKAPAFRKGVPRPYGRLSAPPVAHPLASQVFFDALGQRGRGLPSPTAIGDHLVIDGVARQTVTTSTTHALYVIYQFTPTSLNLFVVNGSTGVVSQYATPQLATANPTSIRPMRASLRIRNLTVFTSLTGSVRALSTPQQFEWDFGSALTLTAGSLASLQNMMASHPSVRSYAQSEMTKTKAWVIPPASTDGFEKYADFTIPFNAATGQLALINGATQVAQNLLIIELNAASVAQTMDISLHTQSACRFPASTLYSNLTQDPVKIGADRYHGAIHRVQATASEGIDHDEMEQARKRRGIGGSSSMEMG